jgi:hypothetical protein
VDFSISWNCTYLLPNKSNVQFIRETTTFYDGQVQGFESMRDTLSLHMVYQIKHSKLNMNGTKTTQTTAIN